MLYLVSYPGIIQRLVSLSVMARETDQVGKLRGKMHGRKFVGHAWQGASLASQGEAN